MDLQIPTSFSTPFLGELHEVRPGISKTRLGIYYLGKNRNRGFITEEFSALLDKNIPYQPIVGIYSVDEGDFKGHSEDKGEAAIYGLIPENPNLGWESRVDKDGVERTYRTADVYLYTGRLDIARSIPGHPQSMELNPKTLKGDWKLIDGEPYFVYTEGAYIGFSVLGKNVEPCFEGSHFYTKDEKENFFELLTKFSYFMENGGKIMEDNKNPSIELENQDPVVEEPAATEELENEPVEQAAESDEAEVNNDESESENEPENAESDAEADNNEVENDLPENEDEEAPIEPSIVLSGEALASYNKLIEQFTSVDEVFVKFSTMENEISNLNGKIVEFENLNNTLQTEAAQRQADFDSLKADYEAAKTVITDMKRKKKKALCEKYSKVVSPDAMEALESKMDEYTVEEFEKELSYAGRESLFNPLNSAPASYSCAGDSHLRKLLEKAKEQNRN